MRLKMLRVLSVVLAVSVCASALADSQVAKGDVNFSSAMCRG